MAQQVEMMDVDDIHMNFDNKENTFQLSNVLGKGSTEKGYEELDVSELNMKLRYSMTPAGSPMSKSFTIHSADFVNPDHNNFNDPTAIENNLTRSLDSTFNKTDLIRPPKTLPLQLITADQINDKTTILHKVETIGSEDVQVIVNTPDDEDLSYPSTSASPVHTPEAVTPTKEIPREDGGSPIMRGLKSVLNMFRPSQTSILPMEDSKEYTPISLPSPALDKTNDLDCDPMCMSTPVVEHKTKSVTRKITPQRDSIIFNDDLEKELEWKEDTIIFSQERIPIHKLLFQPVLLDASPEPISIDCNKTVEYMDISYNNSEVKEQSTTGLCNDTENASMVATVDSFESEFVDCETTYNKCTYKDSFVDLKDTLNNNDDNVNIETKLSQLRHEVNPDSTILESQENVAMSIPIPYALSSTHIVNDLLPTVINTGESVGSEEIKMPLINVEEKINDCESLNVNPNVNVTQSLTGIVDISNKTANDTTLDVTETIHITVDIAATIPLPDDDDVDPKIEDIPAESFVINEFKTENMNQNTSINSLHSKDKYLINEERVPDSDSKIIANSTSNLSHDRIESETELFNVLSTETEYTNILDVEKLNLKDVTETDKSSDNNEKVCINNNNDNSGLISEVVADVDSAAKVMEGDSLNQDLANKEIVSINVETDNNKSILKTDEINITEITKGKENSEIESHNNDSFTRITNTGTEISTKQSDSVIVNDNCYEEFVHTVQKLIPTSSVNNNVQLNEYLENIPSDKNNACESMGLQGTSETIEIMCENKDNTHMLLESPIVTQNEIPINLKELNGSEISDDTKSDRLETSISTEELCQENRPSELEASTVINQDLEDTEKSIDIQFKNIAPESDVEVKSNIKEEPEIELLSTQDKDVSKNIVDEEITVSESNSPYVSLSNEITKSTEIEIPLEPPKSTSPLSSPKIFSKGYNFNFDEIEDPFATKCKIRTSPSRELNKTVIEMVSSNKTDVDKDRRKSHPIRKKPCIKTITKESPKNQTISNKKEKSKKTLEEFAVNDLLKAQTSLINNNINNNESDIEVNEPNLPNIPVDPDESNNKKITDETVVMDNNLPEKKSPSSSEQSTYYSCGASSTETIESKNVFNLPEIVTKNSDTFITNSLIKSSPPSYTKVDATNLNNSARALSNIDTSVTVENKDDSEAEKKSLDPSEDTSSLFCKSANASSSSKTSDDNENTIREITENENHFEEPVLETDIINEISNNVGDKTVNMINFSDVPVTENTEPGELFIDAEAFEFLMNQNQCSDVADSGKESLFLKFDPLFARRMTSEGVAAALSQVRKKQGTPKKEAQNDRNTDLLSATPTPEPHQTDVTRDLDLTCVDNRSIDDLNITVTKPMMVVPPAVYPVAAPRNQTPPTNHNRRSMFFSSPAMAVIDRLLSFSPGQNATINQVSNEQSEADIALLQLREILAEKEIQVQNLKVESRQLKERLTTLETQMKTLEIESEARLRKVTDLEGRLVEKTKINKSMALVVEEYERTIATLIAEKEQDKKRHADERNTLIRERDEQVAHLASMEVSFSDLHSKYEKSKQLIMSYKANEDIYNKSIKEFEENLVKMHNNYELLKQHATTKLNHANDELEKINKAHESEVLKLNAMMKRKDLHITSLEETLAQKTKANEELTAICDELINKVG